MRTHQRTHQRTQPRTPRRPGLMTQLALLATVALGVSACSSIGLGISIPVGGIGSIGVGVGSDGRVNGGVVVGRGGVSVGVGGTADLPRRAPEPAASAASAARP
jgi:hypothetical protein